MANNQGGKREGAGRKPSPETRKVSVALRIAQEIREYLSTVENQTATVEQAIRGTKAFREWRKSSG